MPRDFLHNHPQFADLIRIVAEEKGIDPALVEKDYWIMHCLYGLQQLGFKFQFKGGTSLSKGHQIVSRFSEDSGRIRIRCSRSWMRNRPFGWGAFASNGNCIVASRMVAESSATTGPDSFNVRGRGLELRLPFMALWSQHWLVLLRASRRGWRACSAIAC
jgi:hypothetical protein